jgi:hypothetical protein
MHPLAAPVARPLFLAALLILGGAGRALALGTLSQQIEPAEASVGDPVTVSIKVENADVANVQLPAVDGLQMAGTSAMTGLTIDNGAISRSLTNNFTLIPTRAGDFTIPAFDISTRDGGTLHVAAMKLHVVSTGAAVPSATTPGGIPAAPPIAPSGGGPVVLPPSNPAAATSAPDTNAPSATAPVDSSGQPARVFLRITPETTDAFVGESLRMRIEFFIRDDANAQQDSLPTIKGSDFLMNNLSTRWQQDEVDLGGTAYIRNTWMTAISSPKSGDFPLQAEYEARWVKSNPAMGNDPFTVFFGPRPGVAHETIESNPQTIHVHVLPTEGVPPGFSGAIGQFKVTGAAAPDTVAVGEPVTIHFAVSGDGNFGYVKAPVLATDPSWKSYVPESKIEYEDEAHTQAIKTFEQAVIPQTSGSVPLPAANFSYFDPTTKQYVTVPVPLPTITVTGTPPVASTASSLPNDDTAAAAPSVNFAPNRLEAGRTFADLLPAFRHDWFWETQAGLGIFAFALAIFFALRGRRETDPAETLRTARAQALEEAGQTMSEAAQAGDAPRFFAAARHAVQLRLALEWGVEPESLSLAEISRRDSAFGAAVEPLFQEADEAIYSGRPRPAVDLAEWEKRVRELWL